MKSVDVYAAFSASRTAVWRVPITWISVSSPRVSTVARLRITDSWSSALMNSPLRVGIVCEAVAFPPVTLRPMDRFCRKPVRNHSRCSSRTAGVIRRTTASGAEGATANGVAARLVNAAWAPAMRSSHSATSSMMANWRSSVAVLYSALSSAMRARSSLTDIAGFLLWLRTVADVPGYAALSTKLTS